MGSFTRRNNEATRNRKKNVLGGTKGQKHRRLQSSARQVEGGVIVCERFLFVVFVKGQNVKRGCGGRGTAESAVQAGGSGGLSLDDGFVFVNDNKQEERT